MMRLSTDNGISENALTRVHRMVLIFQTKEQKYRGCSGAQITKEKIKARKNWASLGHQHRLKPPN